MEHSIIPFIIVAAVAIASGIAVIATRNSVHSAIFLALNFVCIAILYLLLHAEFLFFVQIAVYVNEKPASKFFETNSNRTINPIFGSDRPGDPSFSSRPGLHYLLVDHKVTGHHSSFLRR